MGCIWSVRVDCLAAGDRMENDSINGPDMFVYAVSEDFMFVKAMSGNFMGIFIVGEHFRHNKKYFKFSSQRLPCPELN